MTAIVCPPPVPWDGAEHDRRAGYAGRRIGVQAVGPADLVGEYPGRLGEAEPLGIRTRWTS